MPGPRATRSPVARRLTARPTPDAEQQPADRMSRAAGRDECADDGDGRTSTRHASDLEPVTVARQPSGATPTVERGRVEPPAEPRPRHAAPLAGLPQPHDACVGCIVSVTTLCRSLSSVPRSICSRSRAPNLRACAARRSAAGRSAGRRSVARASARGGTALPRRASTPRSPGSSRPRTTRTVPARRARAPRMRLRAPPSARRRRVS